MKEIMCCYSVIKKGRTDLHRRPSVRLKLKSIIVLLLEQVDLTKVPMQIQSQQLQLQSMFSYFSKMLSFLFLLIAYKQKGRLKKAAL